MNQNCRLTLGCFPSDWYQRTVQKTEFVLFGSHLFSVISVPLVEWYSILSRWRHTRLCKWHRSQRTHFEVIVHPQCTITGLLVSSWKVYSIFHRNGYESSRKQRGKKMTASKLCRIFSSGNLNVAWCDTVYSVQLLTTHPAFANSKV